MCQIHMLTYSDCKHIVLDKATFCKATKLRGLDLLNIGSMRRLCIEWQDSDASGECDACRAERAQPEAEPPKKKQKLE
jgi:hypothetical protein